ncbi:MAG: RAMP superfamily CRISPR-associated protein [Thermoprotei archaeon]
MTEVEAKQVFYRTLYTVLEAELEVTTVSPLRIGSGRGVMVDEPDLPVIRGADGKPIIPGSSLKGVFRGTLTRLLPQVKEEDLVYIFGGKIGEESTEEGGQKSGKFSVASPLLFRDLLPTGSVRTAERQHIRIDPCRGGVQEGGLFNVEYVPENVTFKGGIIARNFPVAVFAGLVCVVRTLINQDIVRLGGFKSRGYGSVKMNSLKYKINLRNRIVFETKLGSIRKDKINRLSYEVDEQAKMFRLDEVVDDKEYKKELPLINFDKDIIGRYSAVFNGPEFDEFGKEVLEKWLTNGLV